LKAVIVEEIGKAVLKEMPLADPGFEEVKVRIAYCGVGAFDPFIITGELTLPLPWRLGYQASGIIEELGPGAVARGLQVGDRVALDQYRYCGSCYNCMHDRETFCERRDYPYGYLDQMMAEYIVVHQRQAWKLPDSISLEEATLTENIGACLPAMDLAPPKMGAKDLTVVEPVSFKRDLALKLGAKHVIDPKNQDWVAEALKISPRGFDRVIEASGYSEMLPPCIDLVAHCGKIVLFGVYPDNPKLDYDVHKIWFKEASIHGVFGQSNLFPRAVDMLESLDLKSMMDGPTFPLEDFMKAIEAHKTGQYARVLVKCT
jgi:(R,R)-butanediol dehydrogenase/meso-butanediol dehydrogenase/diacetyl reductase/L-iditol 2-dehydrogenase